MKKMLLVIGDLTKDGIDPEPNLRVFLRTLDKLSNPRLPFRMVTYQDVLSGELPAIEKRKIIAVFFFPFKYWNEQIEVYDKDNRIYGDIYFGRDFKKLFTAVERILMNKYGRRHLKFVNSPSSCSSDRDKKYTQRILSSKGVPTPRAFNIKTIAQINKLLSNGVEFYIKPRFGAMGKGITFLSKDRCFSNYIFRKGKIISRPYDYNWNFKPIGKRDEFLKALIKKDMLWEESVNSPLINRGRRFDMRIYVAYDKVPYLYAKTALKKKIVTNWSQGGKIHKDKRFLKKWIGQRKLNHAKTVAKQAAKVLNLNFCGIDIIFSEDFKTPYVLDAQSFPSFERGFNLMKHLAGQITRR